MRLAYITLGLEWVSVTLFIATSNLLFAAGVLGLTALTLFLVAWK